MAGGGSGARVIPEYVLTVLPDGTVHRLISDGRWHDAWTYESWEQLLATQTFSPYARVFVRVLPARQARQREGA